MKRKRPKPQSEAEPEPALSRAEYFSERQLLIEARQRSYQRAEQMIVGGATGALLLSITFLEKLVASPVVVRPSLLVAAWVTLLVALSASLVGQYASGRSFGCEINCLDASMNDEPEPGNRWRIVNTLCGVLSAALLVLGISLLAAFAYLNAPFRHA